MADPLFKKAQRLFCYVAKKNEVQTDHLLKSALKQKKEVYVPKYSAKKKAYFSKRIAHFPNDLTCGKFGILEPKGETQRLSNLNKIDLFIIPGVSYDKKGTRLGRGKGHFDQYLKDVFKSSCLMGLAFDCQVMPRLPKATHDIQVSRIITEKRTIKIKK